MIKFWWLSGSGIRIWKRIQIQLATLVRHAFIGVQCLTASIYFCYNISDIFNEL